jgi:hypothetical protein
MTLAKGTQAAVGRTRNFTNNKMIAFKGEKQKRRDMNRY